MSRINLVLPSDRSNTASPDKTKSRQFFLKTAEGKCQRVTPLDYENRIKVKMSQMVDPYKTDLFGKFN
jgi:hypothetical protein